MPSPSPSRRVRVCFLAFAGLHLAVQLRVHLIQVPLPWRTLAAVHSLAADLSRTSDRALFSPNRTGLLVCLGKNWSNSEDSPAGRENLRLVWDVSGLRRSRTTEPSWLIPVGSSHKELAMFAEDDRGMQLGRDSGGMIADEPCQRDYERSAETMWVNAASRNQGILTKLPRRASGGAIRPMTARSSR